MIPSFPYGKYGAGTTPIPVIGPVPIIVDCIHNAITAKNQDEFSFRGENPVPLLKFSTEKFYGDPGQARVLLSAGACRSHSVRLSPGLSREEGFDARSSLPTGAKREETCLRETGRRMGVTGFSLASPFPGKPWRSGNRAGRKPLFYPGRSPPYKGTWKNFLVCPPFS